MGIELYYGNLVNNDRVFLKNYNGRDISGIALGYEKAYSGNYHEFELNYQYNLLNLGFNYDYNDAEGKTQSYSSMVLV